MEVLIEIVVAILKALFGESAKTVDTSHPPRRPGGTPGKRGPYNYGDAQQSSSGGRPKTLEEILEEVRRQAQQGNKPQPAQPSMELKKPTPIVREMRTDGELKPAAEERQLSSIPVSAEEPTRPVAQPSAVRAPEAVTSPVHPEGQTPPKTLMESERRAQSKAEAARPKAQKQPQQRPPAKPQPQTAVPAGRSVVLQALRSRAPASRVQAAREALIAGVIFGPPRGFQRYKPGGRN